MSVQKVVSKLVNVSIDGILADAKQIAFDKGQTELTKENLQDVIIELLNIIKNTKEEIPKDKHIIIEKYDFDKLTEYDKDAIYLVLKPYSRNLWRFGDTFPVKFDVSWVFNEVFPIKF